MRHAVRLALRSHHYMRGFAKGVRRKTRHGWMESGEPVRTIQLVSQKPFATGFQDGIVALGLLKRPMSMIRYLQKVNRRRGTLLPRRQFDLKTIRYEKC